MCCCRWYGWTAEFDETVPKPDGAWREMILMTHLNLFVCKYNHFMNAIM